MDLFIIGTKTNILYPHQLAYLFLMSRAQKVPKCPILEAWSLVINPKHYNRRQVA